MAVVRHGGFSAAATALHIAQSAVSIAMKELEREIGSTLFLRTRRTVELTDSGRLLRDRAAPAMALLAGVKDEIRSLDNLAIGQIRIAAPAMVTQFALGDAIASFMQQHPGIRIRAFQAGALEIEELVRTEALDFGLTAYRGAQVDVESEPLWSIDNVACMSTTMAQQLRCSSSIGWKRLLGCPLAAYPQGHHQRELMERYATRLGIALNIVLESDNPALLLSAVRAGHAATTLPLPAIASEPDIQPLRLPHEEGDQLKVGLCWPAGRPLSRAARALLEHLRAYPQQIRKGRKKV